MKMKIFLVTVFCTLSVTVKAQVEIGNKGTLSALAFGDYYWIPSNHNSDLEGNNGFWIRRVYFTYDRTINDSFSARLRLEMSSTGDFVTNAKLAPTVKDAYLKWKNKHHQILAGISPTPTFSFVEHVWGYRAIEKTPLDLQKMASSRDIGLSFKGELGKEAKLSYDFMVANGNSNKSELNKGKKVMLAVGYELTNNVTLQAYGDWNDNPDHQNIYTMQGFLAYQTKNVNIGALYAHQIQQNVQADRDLGLDIASLFTHFFITDNAKGVLRADHLFEGNPFGPDVDYIPFSSQAASTLLIAGVDFILDSSVHLMPNIESVVYGQTPQGITPKTDVIPRLTLYFHF